MICAHCHLEDRGGIHSPVWCCDFVGPPVPVVVNPVRIKTLLDPRPVDRTGRAAAYRAGTCTDCRTARHSAGRPRCTDCHDARAQARQAIAPGCLRGRLGVCALVGCHAPTVPGKVLCSPCTRALVGKKEIR
jgi:hypothetical protein